jgi:hypothetical protein
MHSLFVGLIHYISVFLQLRQFHFILLYFLVSLPADVFDLRLESRHDLIIVPLILLLQMCDLILQPNRLLQFPIVLGFELPLYLCFVVLRLSEPLMHHTERLLPTQRLESIRIKLPIGNYQCASANLQILYFFLLVIEDLL